MVVEQRQLLGPYPEVRMSRPRSQVTAAELAELAYLFAVPYFYISFEQTYSDMKA